jgi:hypothetical protein
MDAIIEQIAQQQDGLISRAQALTVMSQPQISSRLGRRWQVVLPGIYAIFTGSLAPRQRLRAALMHGGAGAMVNDVTALEAYRLPYVPPDRQCRVLVPAQVQRSSRDFVVVRRTTRPPRASMIAGLPVVPVSRALCEFGARWNDERESFAVWAAAVQRGWVSIDELTGEIEASPNRGKPRLMRAFQKLAVGLRSAPEADFRQLLALAPELPQPLWNCLLQLPDGRVASPDALFADAALIHETNGREFHAGQDDFEDMQRRHDALVVAGFTVLHNSPARIGQHGRDVISEVASCHRRLVGRGMPAGVVLLRSGPPGAYSARVDQNAVTSLRS